MAPLPENSVDTYFVDYTTGRYAHQLQFRTTDAAPVGDVDAAIANVVDQFIGIAGSGMAYIGARYRAAGSTITVPVSLPLTATAFSTPSATPLEEAQEPRQVTYLGRGPSTGRKVRWSVFGLRFNTPDNYMFIPSAPGDVTYDVIQALRDGADSGIFITIGGDNPYIYDKADVNYNSHWEAEARG